MIAGPHDWFLDRDYELCRRIRDRTHFGVHSRAYDITSTWNADEKRPVPAKWITRIYRYAKTKKYRCLHLVGFSGGGAVASSQLVDYPDDMVRSLVVISGPIALDKPHMNAANYADRIKPRSLLIYGTEDDFRKGAEIWRKRKPAEPLDYPGGHDFGRKGQESFEKVANGVIEWLKKSEDQNVRSLGLRHRRIKTRAKRKR